MGKVGVIVGEYDDFFVGGIKFGEIGLGQVVGNGLGRYLSFENEIDGVQDIQGSL